MSVLVGMNVRQAPVFSSSAFAVSRVKSIDGIMFKSDFGMARFQARSSVTRRLRNLDKGETGPAGSLREGLYD